MCGLLCSQSKIGGASLSFAAVVNFTREREEVVDNALPYRVNGRALSLNIFMKMNTLSTI